MEHDLDLIIDQCLADIAAGKATPEACAARYPQYADLREQLRAALRLRAAQVPPLTPTQRAELHDRILARAAALPRPAAPVVRGPASPRRWSPRRWSPQRWLPALAFAAAALIIIVGIVPAAAQSTLPGHALYPIKRLTEQVRVALAPDAAQPEVHLDLARVRLGEYEQLAAQGIIDPALLDQSAAEIRLTLTSLPANPTAQTQPILMATLQIIERVDGLVASINGGDELPADSPLAALADYRDQIRTLLSMPAAAPIPTATATATVTPTTTSTPSPTTIPVTPEPEDGGPPITPPGLVKTPKPANTPPGQVKTPKPTKEPLPTKPPKETKAPK